MSNASASPRSIRLRRLRWLVSAAGLAMAAAPAAVYAQAKTAQVDEVVVTGTYLAHVITPSPVTTIGQAQLSQSGRGSLGEMVSLSSEFGFTAVYQDITSNSQSPAEFLNLRGLGPSATLVLLDGRRQVNTAEPDGNGNFGVDISGLMPSIMVDRVDIVKDGASALYGSDAVAGVVNFLTRSKFSGAEIDISDSGREAHDNPVGDGSGWRNEVKIDAIIGGGNDKAHVVVAAEYYKRDSFIFTDTFPEARAHAEDPVFASTSSNGFPPSFNLTPGPGQVLPAGLRAGQSVADPLCGSSVLGPVLGSGGRLGILASSKAGTVCRYNNWIGKTAIGGFQRMNAIAIGSYDASNYLHIKAEVGGAVKNFPFDGSIGRAVTSALLLVPASNPGNPFGIDATYNGRLPGKPFANPTDSYTYRAAVNFSGDMPMVKGWHWDLDFAYSENKTNATTFDFITANLRNAFLGLGGFNCNPATGKPGVGDCHYYNPSASALLAAPGSPLYNSPELEDYIEDYQTKASDARLKTIRLLFTGDLGDALALPGGKIGLALGYEGRGDYLEKKVDPITEQGGFAFTTQESPFHASQWADSAFFEVVAPVLSNLELQGAGRWEKSGSASSFDPKVGILYKPTSRLTLRGSYGTSFRTPDLLKLFGIGEFPASVNAPGIEGASAQAIVVPNPDLTPEHATSRTIGIDYTPIDGLRLSVGYWDYDFKDIAAQESPQLIIDEFVAGGGTPFNKGNAPNAAKLQFDPVTGRLQTIAINTINVSSMRTSGVDFGGSWRFDIGSIGAFTLSGGGTWVSTYKYQERADLPFVDGVGKSNGGTFAFPAPEWKGNVSLNWERGGNSVLATVRYIGGLIDSTIAESAPANRNTEGMTTLDLLYSYRFDPHSITGPLTVRFGINNVFDKIPPLQGADRSFPYIPGVYDPRGRYYSVSATKSF